MEHGQGGGEQPEQSEEQGTQQEGGGQRQDGGSGDAQVPGGSEGTSEPEEQSEQA